MLNLYDFQVQACREIWRELILKDKPSCLLVAPTGSGKTLMFSWLVKQMIDHLQFDATVFAHRREIVKQTAAKMAQANVWPGILMSGDVLSPSRNVQVCSIDSYVAWVKSGKIRELRPRLCVVDEAHRSMSPTYHKVITDMRASGTKLLGVTATPIRTDGHGLGDLYDSMVQTPDVGWMIEHGFLVPMRYFVGIVPDVSGVKLTAGDYNQLQLAQVLNQKLLVGSILDNWRRHAAGRPTMCFATGVEHSMGIVERFNAAGIKAVHIDGTTDAKVRDQAVVDLASGAIQLISNANVYVEGTDIPAVACIIDAQPTKSVGRYLQKAGRGMRTSPGKDHGCVYLDHAGNVYRHGRVEIHREWLLTKGKEMADKLAADRKQQQVERVCPVCGQLFTGKQCPACGDEYARTGKELDYLPADLAAMTFEQAERVKIAPSPKEKQQWLAQALGYAQAMGKKPGWAAHCYEAKWKEGMPPREWMTQPPAVASEAVQKYMMGQLRRFAIAKVRAALKQGVGRA